MWSKTHYYLRFFFKEIFRTHYILTEVRINESKFQSLITRTVTLHPEIIPLLEYLLIKIMNAICTRLYLQKRKIERDMKKKDYLIRNVENKTMGK